MLHRIVVPLDGSALAEQALATAAMIAARAGIAPSIELLRVNTRSPATQPWLNANTGAPEERIYVNAIAEEFGRLYGLHATGRVIEGDAGPAIVQHAREIHADLIIMTTHGRTGLRRAIAGSIADEVVRDAGRPVLVQRPAEHHDWRTVVVAPFERIFVPIDRTQSSASILGAVLELCRWLEARPILARVVHPVSVINYADAGAPSYAIVDTDATRRDAAAAQDELTELAIDIESDGRVRVETIVRVGSEVGAALLEAARDSHASLIAMATHSRGASRLVFGSVADSILRGTHLPLLLLHPESIELAAGAPRVARGQNAS